MTFKTGDNQTGDTQTGNKQIGKEQTGDNISGIKETGKENNKLEEKKTKEQLESNGENKIKWKRMNELPKKEEIELFLVKKLVTIDPTGSSTGSDEDPIDATEVKEAKAVATTESADESIELSAEETTNLHEATLIGVPFDPGGTTFDPGGHHWTLDNQKPIMDS